jgi:hypothetical protein
MKLELELIEDDLLYILEVARNALRKPSMRETAAQAFDVENSELERTWVRLEAYSAKTSARGHQTPAWKPPSFRRGDEKRAARSDEQQRQRF